MRTVPKLSLALLLVALLAVPAAATATITPVVHGRADEWGPAAGSGGISWNRYTNRDFWVDADAGSGVFRVNPANSWAWNGSIEGSVLTYQQVSRRGSDILRYDIVALSKEPAPANVNSKWWEYAPSQSGEWVFFARTNVNYGMSREWRQLLLVNTSTGEKRVLAKGPAKADFWPSQVNGNWAVWEDCPKGGCVVYRYDIAGDVNVKIPQGATDQYGPAVSSDGTIYFGRISVSACKGVSIVRRAPDGTETTLYEMPKGFGAGEFYMYDGPTHDLYFQDWDCAHNYTSDIYKIVGADTASPVVTQVASMPGGSDTALGGRFWLTPQQEAAARMTP